MSEKCRFLDDCAFVLMYVNRVKPHWDDFIKLYCNGEFQDVCQRLKWFTEQQTRPPAELMPTGHRVPTGLDT